MATDPPAPERQPEPADPPNEPAASRWPAQIGGFVTGLVGGVLFCLILIMSGLGALTFLAVGLLLVGAIVAIAKSSVRSSGSGFLAGMAIGYIVFAGSCGLLLLPLLTPR